MKKITLLILLLSGFILKAQNNTTSIETDEVQLDYFGDFDSPIEFPDGSESYRKIMMTCELGQYDCPAGTQYCHQWDYTVEIELITDEGTYEMGRFITPFATTGWPRFGSDWKQPYVFDVTDFYPLLQGEKNVRIHYSGYSGGFTAKLKFDFVEGTPERNVVGIKKAYEVSQTYGDTNDPFNDHLETFSDTAPAGTEAAQMKVLVTGHGSDDNFCCEFDSHYYDVLLNNTEIAEQEIWRNDCGENDLYPQGGTWIYDRSNWCPGSEVTPIYHSLPNISEGTSFDVDVQFETYNGSGNLGSYDYNAIIFYYGALNKTVDAAITNIIAPSNDPHYYRENPSGSIPKINVRNTGNTPITSIDFNYGVKDSTQVSYTWTGNLPALENKTITLPALTTLINCSLEEVEEPQEFDVEITGVNNQTDDDEDNNFLSSAFVSAPMWPSSLMLKLKTSNLGVNGNLNQNPADVSWEITDMEGNVVASRTNANVSTQYNDEVNLSETGFYKLKLTSTNCFGLHWWPLDQSASYESGNFRVTSLAEENLPMNNYTYNGTPHDDWGCSYTQYFSVYVDPTASVDEVVSRSFAIYPNPAQKYVYIDLKGNYNPPYSIELMDIQGRKVYEATSRQQHIQLPVNQLTNGMYLLIFNDGKDTKRVERVLISN